MAFGIPRLRRCPKSRFSIQEKASDSNAEGTLAPLMVIQKISRRRKNIMGKPVIRLVNSQSRRLSFLAYWGSSKETARRQMASAFFTKDSLTASRTLSLSMP